VGLDPLGPAGAALLGRKLFESTFSQTSMGAEM
jgi:hypothetical protein